eukprot:GFUD01018757.1.p1 GENE.GFUD01018757.1~~GFUD01018757.1.p1  ORF type:complete len:145 (-),score=21.77 GFUD01018757.1:201-635(-)
MPLPAVPRLSRFCVCMDVPTGVRNFTLGLIVLWILYALGAVFGPNSSQGNKIWSVIWCLGVLAAYVLVILAMKKSNKMLMLPALIISVFNVVVGTFYLIISFLTLNIIGAIFILIIVGITAYYTLGLKTVYDDMSAGVAPAEPV